MKIRNGFVSNSSSSSFTCNVCGETVSGWDLCMSEAEMTECQSGHCFCDDHMLKPSIEQLKNIILNDEYADDELKEEAKDENDVDALIEMAREIDDFRYEADSAFCPICNFLYIESDMAVKYLLKKNGITMDKLISEIKSEFKDYNEFMNFLKDKGEINED